MSEQLLKAIIKLMVIVAKEDGVVLESEKESVKKFLYENVSQDDVGIYLQLLDQHIRELNPDIEEEEQINQLTQSINAEMSRPQKLVIMVKILELVMVDHRLTPREKRLLQFLGECFRFNSETVEAMRRFVVSHSMEQLNDKYYLLVSGESNKLKNNHLQLDRLKGLILFFHLPQVPIYFVKYIGDDLITLNGQPIPSGHTKILSNGCILKGKNTQRLYYSEIIGAYHKEKVTTNISFVADNIQHKFSNGKIGLNQISLSENKGCLFGIMGGSGAGKSTLLNILNGTYLPTAGTVKINGINIHKYPKKVEGIIGYVPQDDLLIEDITVYQNLYYAAKLCFSEKSRSQIDDLVNKTLESLGLTATKHLKVGNPLKKTISGGQRKRLNIGLELLREPSVLFVDEPTSGLSSSDSENIMDLLKELSLRGKMIFVVIHQPSSDIFKMFDKLLLLDLGGYQIYYGNPVEAVAYFKDIVDMLDKAQSACIECGNVNPEQIFNIIETKVVDEYGRFTKKRKYTPKKWNEIFNDKIKKTTLEEVKEIPQKNVSIPNKLVQFLVFLQRDLLSKMANRQYVFINLFQAPILAFLLAIFTKYAPQDSEYTFYHNENISVFFFMSIIASIFMGLTVSAEEIIKDKKILKRELFLHLSRMSYLSSKMFTLFFLSAIQSLFFVIVGNCILQIEGMTLWYWIILFSTSCFANLLGLNISSSFNSIITIYILIPLLIIPQLILSGVVIPFDKLNRHLTNKEKVPILGEIMVSRWAFEALTVTQFKDNFFTQQHYILDRKIAENTYKTLFYTKFLQKELDFCHQHPQHEDTPQKLELLQKEIKLELKIFGEDKFLNVASLNSQQFDENIYRQAAEFISTIHHVYSIRRKKAMKQLESMDNQKNKLLNSRDFLKEKYKHENERIIYLLKNIGSHKKMIISEKNKIVQNIYPIYNRNNNPEHLFDFRTNMYFPEKYFAGIHIDTKIFNVLMIWFMCICLIITLYFNMLRKLIALKFLPKVRWFS